MRFQAHATGVGFDSHYGPRFGKRPGANRFEYSFSSGCPESIRSLLTTPDSSPHYSNDDHTNRKCNEVTANRRGHIFSLSDSLFPLSHAVEGDSGIQQRPSMTSPQPTPTPHSTHDQMDRSHNVPVERQVVNPPLTKLAVGEMATCFHKDLF